LSKREQDNADSEETEEGEEEPYVPPLTTVGEFHLELFLHQRLNQDPYSPLNVGIYILFPYTEKEVL